MDAYEAAFEVTPVLLRYPAGDKDDRKAKNVDRKFGYHDDSFAWATLDTGKKGDAWFYMTALKAAGVSLYRLTVPILLVATTVAGALWLLGESVVPRANREAKRLEDRIEGRGTARSYRAADRQWLLSRDNSSMYNFLRYDAPTRTLIRFTMFEVDENMELKYHLFTHRARFIEGQWVADSGWLRQFYADGSDRFQRITRPLVLRKTHRVPFLTSLSTVAAERLLEPGGHYGFPYKYGSDLSGSDSSYACQNAGVPTQKLPRRSSRRQ